MQKISSHRKSSLENNLRVRRNGAETTEEAMTRKFNSIETVIADLQAGKMVIVVDDADRENEGDLIMAAQYVSPPSVNFMAKHGRGLICVTTTSERLQQLGIERMVKQNRETFKTDFQISVDATRGITTGISAPDRAETIRILA